jgi:hypothetical protein
MNAPIPDGKFGDFAKIPAVSPILIMSGLPDDGVINRSDPQAMLAWARILGVHHAQILIAVAVVGPAHGAVRDYLRNSKTCFSDGN